VNSSADTSVPAETFTAGVFSDYSSNIEDFGGGAFDGGDAEPVKENPDDVLDKQDIDPQLNNFVVWYDNESARVFGSSSAVITLDTALGTYQTTTHLGQTAFAPAPDGEANGDNHTWHIQMPDELTSSNFTIEAWMRSNDAPLLSGFRFGYVFLGLVDPDAEGAYMLFSSQVDETYQQNAQFRITYGEGVMDGPQSFGTTVQGWKHLCYQRISGEDVFHYHGTRIELTQISDEPLPSFRPISSNAYLSIFAENKGTSGTALGQVRAAVDAKYGFGNFTPPSIPFYSP
jgi:hypothetical protein